jgi:hypothetical protein
MYHLGLWFNSPADAQKATCPGATTPFNGEHDAGIQVLNTSNFPVLSGPSPDRCGRLNKASGSILTLSFHVHTANGL